MRNMERKEDLQTKVWKRRDQEAHHGKRKGDLKSKRRGNRKGKELLMVKRTEVRGKEGVK